LGILSHQQKLICLTLPIDRLDQINVAANKRDAPYQFLIKVWLPGSRTIFVTQRMGELDAVGQLFCSAQGWRDSF